MTIKSSLDWNDSYYKLHTLGSKLNNSRDMIKILNNITEMVSALSNEEINCRRLQRQTATHKILVANINHEIDNYEQLVTMGILCGC